MCKPTWRSKRSIAALIVAVCAFGPVARAGDMPLKIGGSGAALGAMSALGHAYAREQSGFAVDIAPSLGSSGGIRAVLEGAMDIGVSARPLTGAEAASGARAVACFSTPFVFVTSNFNVDAVALKDLPRLFSDPSATWPDGEMVSVILRPKVDTSSFLLVEKVPGMALALEVARLRPDVPIAATDQENLRMAQSMAGSLAAATLTQYLTERPALRLIALDGVLPEAAKAGSDSYRLAAQICLIARATLTPVARRFIDFVRSSAAESERSDAGLRLLDTAAD